MLKPWSRIDWLILILLAALVALFYWRILTPNLADRQSFPPGDFQAQFWAFATFEGDELLAGRLPLWNPYTFGGSPFWADVQAAVFYPPSLLTLFLAAPGGFSLFALEVEAIAHIWLAAVFMYLFIRRITGNRPAAFIASLTFTFSGYLTGYPSQQLAVLEADVWLPLALFFIYIGYERLPPSPEPERPTRSPIPMLLLAGMAWGMALLAGHPQSGLIVAYVSTAYFFFLWLIHAPLNRPQQMPVRFSMLMLRAVPRALGHWFIFIVTGLALAAIQFLPAAEYTLLSVRAEGSYDKMSGGFPLTDIIQLLLPGQVSFYSPLYVGVVGLILAIWAVFAASARNRHTVFWAILTLLTLLISFGGNTFLYSPLYLFGPGFSIFRGQERWAFAAAFSLSVLAGYGFKALLSPANQPESSRPPVPLRLIQFLFFFALLLTFLFFFGLNDTGWRSDSPFFNLLGGATLLTTLLTLTWLLWKFSPRLPPLYFTGLTAALICFDLFTVNWQTNLYPQPPEWHTQMPPAVAAIKTDAALTPDDPYRVYNEFRLYDNYGVPFKLEDLWGASPLRPERYDKFLAPPMPIERVWELLNVKYVITWRQELFVPSEIIHQEPAEDGATYVHRLNEVGPRAWLVSQAEMADDETILQKIADPAFERWHIALLESNPDSLVALYLDPPDLEQNENGSSVASITRIAPHATHLTYQVTTPNPALLILSEPHYPGWQATLNGHAAPLLRANYILRAVPVPAGNHTVTLTFQPLTFTIGAIISTLALLTITAGLIMEYRKHKIKN